MAKQKRKQVEPVRYMADCPRCKNQLGRLVQRLSDLTAERDGLRHQLDRAHYGGYVSGVAPAWDDHVEVLERVHEPSLTAAITAAQEGHAGARSYSTSSEPSRPRKPCEVCEAYVCVCGAGANVVSDRTGDLAVRMANKNDQARIDLADLGKAKRLLQQAAGIVERLHRRYGLHTPTAMQRQEAENTPGCKSCQRIKVTLSDGTETNRWEPIYRDQLCSWCHEYRRKTAKGWPPTELLRAHHAGKRVTVPVTKAS